jgi:ribose-phosphate pyrophosphokinase
VVDDIIDTAGTLCSAAELLNKHGAKEIYGVATHGLFSGSAKHKIAKSSFKQIIVTDTLPQDKSFKKLVVLPVAPLLASAIKEVYSGGSVSALFPDGNQF